MTTRSRIFTQKGHCLRSDNTMYSLKIIHPIIPVIHPLWGRECDACYPPLDKIVFFLQLEQWIKTICQLSLFAGKNIILNLRMTDACRQEEVLPWWQLSTPAGRKLSDLTTDTSSTPLVGTKSPPPRLFILSQSVNVLNTHACNNILNICCTELYSNKKTLQLKAIHICTALPSYLFSILYSSNSHRWRSGIVRLMDLKILKMARVMGLRIHPKNSLLFYLCLFIWRQYTAGTCLTIYTNIWENNYKCNRSHPKYCQR